MKITYSELLHKVCQFANVLRSQGTLCWLLGKHQSRALEEIAPILCVLASLLSHFVQNHWLLSLLPQLVGAGLHHNTLLGVDLWL